MGSALMDGACGNSGLTTHKDIHPRIKAQRLEAVNDFVQAIGGCGRRFFWSDKFQRFARMEMDARGRLWWIDDYTGARIYTHETTWTSRWRGFSHGGTLRALVEALRDYVLRGETLTEQYFQTREGYSSHPWGYGNDIDHVRQEGVRLGIIASPAEAASGAAAGDAA